jgi:hypothetical protein
MRQHWKKPDRFADPAFSSPVALRPERAPLAASVRRGGVT